MRLNCVTKHESALVASGRTSRAKGVTGERESADLFRAAGFEVVRLQNNVLDAGDYEAALPWTVTERVGRIGLAPYIEPLTFLVDSKRRERLNLNEFSRQVEAVARDGQTPCVVYRRSREPWRVSLRLEDFLRIVAR